MDHTEEQNHEEAEKAEEAATLTALAEALAELERGEGRPMDEALPDLRKRLGIDQSAFRGARWQLALSG